MVCQWEADWQKIRKPQTWMRLVRELQDDVAQGTSVV